MSPQPPRQPGWTCKVCNTWNESFRKTCIGAGSHPQPKPPQPPKKGGA